MLRPKRVPWFVWYIAYLILGGTYIFLPFNDSEEVSVFSIFIATIFLLFASVFLIYVITYLYYKKGEILFTSNRFKGERKAIAVCLIISVIFNLYYLFMKSIDLTHSFSIIPLSVLAFYYFGYMLWWSSGRRNPYYDDGQPEESSDENLSSI